MSYWCLHRIIHFENSFEVGCLITLVNPKFTYVVGKTIIACVADNGACYAAAIKILSGYKSYKKNKETGKKNINIITL